MDEHIDDVGPWVEAVVPDAREDHRLRHDATRIAHQVLEQREFSGPQLDVLALSGHTAGQQIEREIRHFQPGRLRGRRRAADQRLHSCEQLRECEGLREVVVAASLEAAYAIIDRMTRAEDEYRYALAAATQSVDQRETIEKRQAQVDDGHIGARLERECESAFSIACNFNREASLVQAVCDELGERAVVFDDEGAHIFKKKSPAINCTAGPSPKDEGRGTKDVVS